MKAVIAGMAVALGAVMSAWAGSPSEAAAIRKDYQQGMQTWNLRLKAANDEASQRAVWSLRPDAGASAKKMWACIQGSLEDDWTLEPAAWLLRMSPELTVESEGSRKPLLAAEVEQIRTAVEKHHLRSPKLSPMCLGLVAIQDPRSMALLEKIESAHPDPKIQGTAALGMAMLLRNLSDEPEVLKRRLTLLRKAIIESADVELDGATVAKVAEDELYLIRYLTKGRVAPQLIGSDVDGKALKLGDFRGKVVVLTFWNSGGEQAQQLADWANTMQKKYAGKAVAMLGVNHDTTATLRDLQKSGKVTWTNFSDPQNELAKVYRVGGFPLVYVLDKEGKIRFSGAPGSFVELTVDALLSGG